MSDHDSTSEGTTDGDATGDGNGNGNRGLSDRTAFWLSGVLALALAVGSVWLIGVQAIHFEALQRVRPTVEGGGVGAGWVQGNTSTALDWLITLVHFADVILGVFILALVFIHWIAFRRLAARMQPPGGSRQSRETVATDGGERE